MANSEFKPTVLSNCTVLKFCAQKLNYDFSVTNNNAITVGKTGAVPPVTQ